MRRRTKVIIIIISSLICLGVIIFAGIKNISKRESSTESYTGVDQSGRDIHEEEEKEKKLEEKRSKIQDKTKANYRQLETNDEYNIPYNGVKLEDTEGLGDAIIDLVKNKEGLWNMNNGISSIEFQYSQEYSNWYDCVMTTNRGATYKLYICKDHSNGWQIKREPPGTVFAPEENMGPDPS